MMSFSQFAPHGLSRTLSVADVMHFGRLGNVCAKKLSVVQSSNGFPKVTPNVSNRLARPALGEAGSGPLKSSEGLPASKRLVVHGPPKTGGVVSTTVTV